MIDRIAGAESAAAQHLARNDSQRAERAEAGAEAARAEAGSTAKPDGLQAPSAAEAARVAEIAALRDEALALTRTATEAQLAAQAEGRDVRVGRGLGEEAPALAQDNADARRADAETEAGAEVERRRGEAEDMARRIRDGGAGAPHGGGAKVDATAVRELLGE